MKKILRTVFHRVVVVALLMALQLALIVVALMYFETYYLYLYFGCQLVSVVVVIHILNGRRNPAYKLVWIIPLLLLPVFGLLLYLLFGRVRMLPKKRAGMHRAIRRGNEALYRAGTPFPEALSADSEAARQARYLSDRGFATPLGLTHSEYFPLGEDMFLRMKEELQKAERYIFIESFIIEPGVMWNAILDILTEKAAAGVDVRVLYDDMGCIMTLPHHYDRNLEGLGIRCGVFNPFVPVLSSLFNNRSHRKTCIIDGKTAFTGGINLADEYINAKVKFGHWKDTAVMLKGEAAWGFTVQFLSFWDEVRGEAHDFFDYRPEYEPGDPAEGYAQPYSDTPLDEEQVGEMAYINIISAAQRYVYITTPYLVIDHEMTSALCTAAKSGVDVRIITPHIRDKWYVHPVTRSYYEQLIESGVKVYEYTPGFIHAKSFVADDTVGVVGTINLDYRSLYLHFECAVWMYKTKAVGQLLEDFRATMAISQPITLADARNVPLPNRVARQILRIFAPMM